LWTKIRLVLFFLNPYKWKSKVPIVKYINNPMMSFKVVTKGPMANAGSILYLCSNKGNKVPKIAAKRITVNKDRLTTIPS